VNTICAIFPTGRNTGLARPSAVRPSVPYGLLTRKGKGIGNQNWYERYLGHCLPIFGSKVGRTAAQYVGTWLVASVVVRSSASRVDRAAALRELHERRGTEDGGVEDVISRLAARSRYAVHRQQHLRLSPLPVSIQGGPKKTAPNFFLQKLW